MKTIAIEFTVTSKAIGGHSPSGHEQLRCRVVIGDPAQIEVFWRAANQLGEEVWFGGNVFWRAANQLGEEVWFGGNRDSGAAPEVAGVYLDRATIIGLAMRCMAESALTSRSRELPNGAIVFDLGTV